MTATTTGGVTAAEHQGRQRSRRTRTGPRDLPPGEWERLLRERSYLRPLPPPVPLHVMGRQRRPAARTAAPAGTVHPDGRPADGQA
jgi:hypothetical protein